MSTNPAYAPAESHDRSDRLMVAGLFEIVLGCLCFLLAGTMGAMLSAQGHGHRPALPQFGGRVFFVQALVTYLLRAVAFFWVGAGLMRARRWALALTVVGSWLWLVMGIVGFFSMVLMVLSTSAAIAEKGNLPQGFFTSMWIMSTAMVGCIYIVPPGILLVLCHGESARATCARRDPKPRWTDRCPLPVLAISLFFAFSVVSLLSPMTWRWTLPMLGIDGSATAGAAIAVSIACVMGYLAWGTYRLQRAAWWGALVVALVGTAYTVVTFRRMDPFEISKKMGMPADETEMMRKADFFDSLSRSGPWPSLAAGIGWLGYLVFLRRYFFRPKEFSTSGEQN